MLAKLIGLSDWREALREARWLVVTAVAALLIVGGLWWIRADAARDARNAPEVVAERTAARIATAQMAEADRRAEAAEQAAADARRRADELEAMVAALAQAETPATAAGVHADLAQLRAAKLARNRIAAGRPATSKKARTP